MDKLKLHTPDLAAENFRKLAALFPNAVTETINEAGEVVRAIDADVLRQEISATVVEGPQERYQFTWPDKKKSVVLANAPIAKTLRLNRSRSVGRDGTRGSIDTENIYIEGDNLDALKLLQETYLGKVKMIYIDPPYNTGNDFIYNDDFSMETEEYASASGQLDEEGNRLVQNTENNGRFHTDWLNMLYPRLRIAKDLLTDDGVIFISIDDNEIQNLRKICNEIFGASNFMAQIIWQKVYSPRMDVQGFSTSHDYILCYVKANIESIRQEPFLQNATQFNFIDPINGKNYRRRSIRKEGSASLRSDRPNSWFPLIAPDGTEVYPFKPDGTEGRWRWDINTYKINEQQGMVEWVKTENGWQVYAKQYLDVEAKKPPETLWLHQEVGHNHSAAEDLKKLLGGKVFDTPKPQELIIKMLKLATYSNTDDIILDFFSGSATTAHAVMQLNAEDGGKRKFIMVQLPEVTGEKSEARKAGYETICDIGEERIRRAGKKIKEGRLTKIDANHEQQTLEVIPGIDPEDVKDLDIGFRVFRVDSTNMEDVYYAPAEYKQEQMTMFADNIKPDRTPEDLLFQVMLDLGILLSSSIEETVIAGKKVFSVAGGYLLACFDKNVTEETVTEIAKRRPFYAVFRDSSMATDSVATNFEQIFETYSPKTVRKVL